MRQVLRVKTGSVVQKIEEDISTGMEKLATKKGQSFLIGILAGATICHAMLIVALYLVAIYLLKPKVLSNNPVYIFAATSIPVVTWFYSTTQEYWNYHRRKLCLLYIIAANAIFTLLQPLYTLLWRVITPNVFQIPTNPALTADMLVFLAQLLITLSTGFVIYVILRQAWPYLVVKGNREKIAAFKIKQWVDLRPDKEWAYDLVIIKDLENGKQIRIKEMDRGTHTFVDGASGTGKTSTYLLPQARNDLEQRNKNEQKRQEELVKLLISGEAEITGRWEKDFRESYITAKPGYEKKLQKVRDKYKSCGMTYLAPNSSIAKDILRLAQAKGIDKVNILDPTKDWSREYPNAHMVTINPFYIEPGLDGEELAIRIAEIANIFSEVLIAINDRAEQTDQYFADISQAVSSNIAMVVMLAKYLNGKTANILDMQELFNDFTKLKEYVEMIETYYGFSVDTATPASKSAVNADSIRLGNEQKKLSREEQRENNYYHAIQFVRTELLGEGAVKMFDQARGLRNLLNKLLVNPKVKRMLSGYGEHRLDFDRMFSENEITVVNTAIELGVNSSTGLGLFFILTQRASLLRRKEGTRTPHFINIDEASQYSHPVYEDMISLYRQYGGYVTLSMQSLSQMRKNRSTQYLEDVVMKAGVHILFGRISAEEMDIYTKLAGTEEVQLAQDTTTQSSIFAENPSMTTSQRITPTQVNIMEGSEMRNRDFQEITIFYTDEGRVLKPRSGKLNFLKDKDFEKTDRHVIAWEKLMPENGELLDGDEQQQLNQAKPNSSNKANTPAAEEEMPAVPGSGTVINIRNDIDGIPPAMSQTVIQTNGDSGEPAATPTALHQEPAVTLSSLFTWDDEDSASIPDDDDDVKEMLNILNNI